MKDSQIYFLLNVDPCFQKHTLKKDRLKMIGDPQQRFREDPVRMLRAIRFASKTKFKLTHELKQAIRESKSLIANVT